jgi:CRP-like cAMP-binding protein
MNNLFTIYTKDEIEIFRELETKTDLFSSTSTLIKISKKISIFKNIPENILFKIVKDIKIIKYKKDELIIEENEKTKSMYYILLGEVNVVKSDKIIATIKPNSIIGEIASLLNQPRTASVYSARDGTTLIEFKIDFTLMQTNLGYYFAIIYKNLSVELAKKLLIK